MLCSKRLRGRLSACLGWKYIESEARAVTNSQFGTVLRHFFTSLLLGTTAWTFMFIFCGWYKKCTQIRHIICSHHVSRASRTTMCSFGCMLLFASRLHQQHTLVFLWGHGGVFFGDTGGFLGFKMSQAASPTRVRIAPSAPSGFSLAGNGHSKTPRKGIPGPTSSPAQKVQVFP